YAAARRLARRLEVGGVPHQVAQLWTSSAIAELGLDHAERASRLARRALAVDPGSPVFLTNAAYTALRAGRTDEAIRRYRGALSADHTLYPAANDLGVLLAHQGR